MPNPAWMSDARCRTIDAADRDLWTPERETPAATAPARQVCAWCPVRTACLEHALALTGQGSPRGVWGATTTAQRTRIRAARRAAREQAA